MDVLAGRGVGWLPWAAADSSHRLYPRGPEKSGLWDGRVPTGSQRSAAGGALAGKVRTFLYFL